MIRFRYAICCMRNIYAPVIICQEISKDVENMSCRAWAIAIANIYN